MKLSIRAMPSAATIDNQMPSKPHNKGNTSTHTSWNKSVLRKDNIAEISPFPSAVKKEEV